HDAKEDSIAHPPEATPLPAKREISGADVPSRIAEQLFWVGRYAERLELVTRLLRTTIHRITGEATPTRDSQLALCLRLLEGLGILPFGTPHSALLPVLAGLMSRNSTGLSGLHTEVRALMWNAASARDRLSDDTWRLFNRLESLLNGESASPTATVLMQKLDAVVLHLAAFAGMQAENMTRGQGWRFLELGRRIERAIGVLNLLEHASHAPDGDLTAPEPLLETCDSAMTYRRRHLSRPRWQPVVELLFSDPTNPRAVAYQLKVLAQEAPLLPGFPDHGLLPRIRDSIAGLQLFLSNAEVPGDWRQRSYELSRLSDLLTQHYFSHSVRHVY
ncbi:MAG TPA: alpha-E domain-containing protein, partial [Luteolibacter sp.]